MGLVSIEVWSFFYYLRNIDLIEASADCKEWYDLTYKAKIFFKVTRMTQNIL